MIEELKKLFRGKLFVSLILLSVLVNAGLLLMQKGKIDGLRVIDDFCRENGSVVSEEKVEQLSKIWDEKVVQDISGEELESNIESAEKYYESIQSINIAMAYCNQMRLEGKAAEFVQMEFGKLDSQIQEAAEQEITFFPPYRMYTFDFISSYLLFVMNLEGIVAAVIVTIYSLDLERSSRTISTVYSTRKGSKILKDKLVASVAGSLICFLAITVTTFLLAGCMFPVKTIMNTLISNPMVSLKGVPCIAKETMTVGMYMFASLGMSGVLVVIYSLGSFAIGLKAKNGYFAFGILIVLLGIMKVFSAAAPTSTCMFFWMQYNPLDLALKAGTWFLYNANNFSPSGYEKCTIAIWISVCVAGCICGFHSLRKEVKQ